jgi:hypothetical protein
MAQQDASCVDLETIQAMIAAGTSGRTKHTGGMQQLQAGRTLIPGRRVIAFEKFRYIAEQLAHQGLQVALREEALRWTTSAAVQIWAKECFSEQAAVNKGGLDRARREARTAKSVTSATKSALNATRQLLAAQRKRFELASGRLSRVPGGPWWRTTLGGFCFVWRKSLRLRRLSSSTPMMIHYHIWTHNPRFYSPLFQAIKLINANDD